MEPLQPTHFPPLNLELTSRGRHPIRQLVVKSQEGAPSRSHQRLTSNRLKHRLGLVCGRSVIAIRGLHHKHYQRSLNEEKKSCTCSGPSGGSDRTRGLMCIWGVLFFSCRNKIDQDEGGAICRREFNWIAIEVYELFTGWKKDFQLGGKEAELKLIKITYKTISTLLWRSSLLRLDFSNFLPFSNESLFLTIWKLLFYFDVVCWNKNKNAPGTRNKNVKICGCNCR